MHIKQAVNQMDLVKFELLKNEGRQSLYFRDPHIIYISLKILVLSTSETPLSHTVPVSICCVTNHSTTYCIQAATISLKTISRQFGLCSACHLSDIVQVDSSQPSSSGVLSGMAARSLEPLTSWFLTLQQAILTASMGQL